MNTEPLHQQESKLLKKYHEALNKCNNYEAKELYSQLVKVREEIKRLNTK